MLKNKSTPIFSRIKLAIRRKKNSDNIVKYFIIMNVVIMLFNVCRKTQFFKSRQSRD